MNVSLALISTMLAGNPFPSRLPQITSNYLKLPFSFSNCNCREDSLLRKIYFVTHTCKQKEKKKPSLCKAAGHLIRLSFFQLVTEKEIFSQITRHPGLGNLAPNKRINRLATCNPKVAGSL